MQPFRPGLGIWSGLVVAALLAPGGAGAAGDTATVGALRSLVAEALATARVEASGRLTRTYADAMRRDAIEQIRDVEKASLKTDPSLSALAREAGRAVGDRDIARLTALGRQLTDRR